MKICDRYLARIIRILGVSIVVGVGKYAADHTNVILRENNIRGVRVVRIMHPSPANPVANREWEPRVTGELIESGAWNTVMQCPIPADYEPPASAATITTGTFSPDTVNSNSNSSTSSILQGVQEMVNTYPPQQQQQQYNNDIVHGYGGPPMMMSQMPPRYMPHMDNQMGYGTVPAPTPYAQVE